MTPTKTDEVLAAAHRDLQAQLLVVRAELERLGADERALTEALASLNGRGTSSAAPASAARTRGRAAKGSARRGFAGKSRTSRRREPRAASKPTAERVKELQVLLADGPKSRNDLAAALEVSPARVQQLLTELGSSVSSRPDPGQRQGKLWRLEGVRNGASASKPARKGGTAKAGSAVKSSAGKPAGSK